MRLAAPFALLLVAAVSFVGSSAFADDKSKRALGRDWDVLVHARVESDRPFSPVLRVVYDVENLREESIEIVHAEPRASWDAGSGTITVNLGSELPIENDSKLVRLGPNEKMTFTTSAPVGITSASRSRAANTRRLVRVRLHFLEAPEGRDTSEATEATEAIWLDRWIEHKRSVVTNAIPISIYRMPTAPMGDAGIRSPRRH